MKTQPKPINDLIMQLIDEYPTDGTHPYDWVPGTTGVTRDLVHNGTRILRASKGLTNYCSCITFELWVRAVSERLNVPTEEMRKLRALWFIINPKKRKGPAELAPTYGEEINIKQALPGDFVQIWRKSGSGHTVVFINHLLHGLGYWSSQPSTNGLGYRVEKWSLDQTNPITETYTFRAKI